MISFAPDPKTKMLPEESRLIQLAQSGDAAAFLQLYDISVEPIYRYVFLQVLNGAAAESITSQVFRLAWGKLSSCQQSGLSFVAWIQEIARNQATDYYKTNLKDHSLDPHYLSVAAEYGLNKEVADLIRLETMRNHLRFLTGDTKQTMILRILNLGPGSQSIVRMMTRLEGDVHVLQVKTLQTVAGFLEHLNLGREIRPSPHYTKRTRSWLAQYLQFHARRRPGPPLFWRMALTYVILVAAFLITGTAKAQSALPGDILYGWKRTSEQAWLSVSPDPVGTNIFLADRRLNEWIAVENDPQRSGKASSDYFSAVTNLKPTNGSKTSARIVTVLKAHSQRLNNAGLSTVLVNKYLAAAPNPNPGITSIQVPATESVQSSIPVPSMVAPPPSDNPVQGVPSTLEVPTAFTPPTDIPTQAPTEVPTVSLPPTEIPTEVAPPPTDAPTYVAPQPTEAPTDAPPPPVPTDMAPTSAPPPATEAATAIANPVPPTLDPSIIPTGAIP